MAPDLPVEALAAYELAKRDAEYARRVWVEAGSPLEMPSKHGGVHPLRKALVEADDRVARRAKDLAGLTRARDRGRPVGSESAPDRVEPPRRMKLRAVADS